MKLSTFQKGLFIVLLASLVLGGIILVNRILLGDVFNKEEAQHAVYGLWLYRDLRALDWGSFWYDTQRQMFWPFLHSWILSLFFLFFGVSYVSARLLSFLIFLAILTLMYVVSCRFSEKSGWGIGILSVLLALTSPMMIRFASENTLEGLGTLIFLAGLYLYPICEEKKLTFYYVLLALVIGLSIYTNYLYAYLLLPAFLVVSLGKLGPVFVEVFKLSRKGEKSAFPFLWWAYRKLVVLAVLLLLAGSWFLTAAFSRKIMLFLQAVFRNSGGELLPGAWQNLIFYPMAIMKDYTFSPWLGISILISLFLPLATLHYRHLGKLYAFVWTVLILATLTVSTKASQFIYIIAPFLFMIFSAAVFYVWEKRQKYLAGGLIIILLLTPISLPQLLSSYFPARPGESMKQVLDYFRDSILPRYPVAISVNLQHLNPEVIAFHFWDWNAPVLADPLVGEAEMFRSARYFLTVELGTNRSYRAESLDDSVYRWNYFLFKKLEDREIRQYSQRRFESLGLTAKIYKKSEIF